MTCAKLGLVCEPDLTPWGESYDDLARAALADREAPPALVMAAFLYRHGEQVRLRSLVADAVALDAAERSA